MRIKTIFLLILLGIVPVLFAPAEEGPSIAISSPEQDELWFGKQAIRVEVRNLPADTLHSLEIYLNGRLLRELKGPPYVFQHDFGKVPKNSSIRALLRVDKKVAASHEIKSLALDDIQEVQVTQIMVPVVVTDSNNNYVSDLGRDDFVLYADNRPQVINEFSHSGKSKFRLALLIDVSSSMKDRIGVMKEAARTFLEKLLSVNDQAIVIFFNHEVFEQTEFSGDIRELQNSLALAVPFGATALYDAVGYSIKLFKNLNGFNIIILFSDGEDNSSFLDPYTLIKKAEKSNALIYAIGKLSTAYQDEYESILRTLAESSGGMLFFIHHIDQIKVIYEKIRQDIRAEYVLGFSPDKSGRDQRYHEIRVQVKGKKRYNVRTVKGFYY